MSDDVVTLPVVRVERMEADDYWRDIIAQKDAEIRELRIDNARLRDEAAIRKLAPTTR